MKEFFAKIMAFSLFPLVSNLYVGGKKQYNLEFQAAFGIFKKGHFLWNALKNAIKKWHMR